jgi:5-methylcytosine-specific restriction protein A
MLLYITPEIQSADEVGHPANYFEEATKTVWVNVYERDRKARDASVAHYGAARLVCGIDFGCVYGELGEGFIHVHHLTPLSKIKKGYSPDPVKYLRPVCPNCHNMIHTEDPPIAVETLREIIGKGSKGQKRANQSTNRTLDSAGCAPRSVK